MVKLKLVVFVALACLSISLGCAKRDSAVEVQSKQFLGRTPSEIERLFGKPKNTESLPDGSVAAFYLYQSPKLSERVTLVGWRIDFKDGRAVKANPIFGTENASSTRKNYRKGIGFFLVQPGSSGSALEFVVPCGGRDAKYRIDEDAPSCILTSNDVEARSSGSADTVSVNIAVEAKSLTSISSFSSSQPGKLCAVIINNVPICVTTLPLQLTSASGIYIELHDCVELRLVLKKVGVEIASDKK